MEKLLNNEQPYITPGYLVWKGTFGSASRYILQET